MGEVDLSCARHGSISSNASLLMAGLDQLSSQVLGTYPSISFRLNLIRTEYRLDHVPEHDTVVLFARSIQSEFEQAAISPSQGTSPKKPTVARADADAPKGGPQKGEQKGDSKGKGGKGEQTQSHNQQPTAQGTGGKGDGAAKSKGQGGAQETQAGSNQLAGGKRPPCAFFLSDAGCKHGRTCQYLHCLHDPSQSPSKQPKCWTCGSTQHRKQDCEAPGGSKAAKPDNSPSGKGTGIGPAGSTAVSASAPQIASGQGPSTAVPKSGSPQPALPVPPRAAALVAPTAEQILADAAARLQNIRLAPLRMIASGSQVSNAPNYDRLGGGDSVVQGSQNQAEGLGSVEGQGLTWDLETDESGLVDSGATHALRCGSDAERLTCVLVDVELAQGTAKLWRNRVHVLLSDDVSLTPIIPMSSLTEELECQVHWDHQGCHIRHPGLGALPVRTVQGCPHLPRGLVLTLISDVEQKRANHMIRAAQARILGEDGERPVKEAWDRLRAIARGGEPLGLSADGVIEWAEGLYAALGHLAGSLCRGMPSHHVAEALGTPDPSVAMITPFNRRLRRSLERSRGVLIHVCSGSQRWQVQPRADFWVLEINVEHGQDFLSHEVWSYVLHLARKGLVRGVIGGPPCSTISRSRSDDDGGPRPIRGRGTDYRYGFPEEELSPQEAVDVKSSNKIWVRFFMLYLLSEAVTEDVFLASEQPEDIPNPRNPNQPSVMEWPVVSELIALLGLRVANFDQHCYGHDSKKPTSVLTSSWDLFAALHECRVPPGQEPQSSLAGLPLHRRLQATKQMAAWAPGLVRMIARAWVKWVTVSKEERRREATAAALQIQHLTQGAFGPYGEVSTWVRSQLWRVSVEDIIKLGRRSKRKDKARLHATRLSSDEASYRRHVLAGHVPYRRDCSTCLRGAAKSRSRRTRIPTADSFTLSLDLAGPFEPGPREDEVVAGKAKRFLLGVSRFPTSESGQPFWDIPTELQAPQSSGPVEAPSDGLPHPAAGVGETDAEDAGDVLLSGALSTGDVLLSGASTTGDVLLSGASSTGDVLLSGASNTGDVDCPWDLSPDEVIYGPEALAAELGGDEAFRLGFREAVFQDGPDCEVPVFEIAEEDEDHLDPEPADPNVAKEAEDQTREWKKQYRSRVDGVVMKSLVFLELLPTKSKKDVLQALQRIVAKLKLYQCPLVLVHTDRGKEFVNCSCRSFLDSLTIKHSTTEADNPSSNGRVEAWIGLIKNATRKLLIQANLPPKYWPLAATHAAEVCHRNQLREVGISAKPLIPFGTRCHVKERMWRLDHRGSGTWSSRVAEGLIVSPSVHVARGYLALVRNLDKPDRLFVSTSLQIEHPQEALEVIMPDPVIPIPESRRPTHRMRGKTRPADVSDEAPEGSVPIDQARLVVQGESGLWEGSVEELLRVEEQGSGASSSHDAVGADELHRLDCLRMRAIKHSTETLQHVSKINARGRLSLQQSEELAAKVGQCVEINRFEVGMLLIATFQKGPVHRQIDQVFQDDMWAKTLGAFVHGGLSGVTNEAKYRPNLVTLCNKLLAQHVPCGEPAFWTALRITCDSRVQEHVDVHNETGSKSYLLPLSYFEGGRMVVGGVPCEFPPNACFVLDPKIPHSVEPSKGVRVMLIGYTPRHPEKLTVADRQLLRFMQFLLPPAISCAKKTPNMLGNRERQQLSMMQGSGELGSLSRSNVPKSAAEYAPPSSDGVVFASLGRSLPLVDVQSPGQSNSQCWFIDSVAVHQGATDLEVFSQFQTDIGKQCWRDVSCSALLFNL